MLLYTKYILLIVILMIRESAEKPTSERRRACKATRERLDAWKPPDSLRLMEEQGVEEGKVAAAAGAVVAASGDSPLAIHQTFEPSPRLQS